MKKPVLFVAMLLLVAAVCRAQTVSPHNDDLLAPLGKLKDRIVFESYFDGNFEIMLMNADGTNKKDLTNTPKLNEVFPQCSPDGKMIAFECCEQTSGSEYRLEVMNADGTGRRILVNEARQEAWSPDSRTLAYVVPTAGKHSYALNHSLSFYNLKTGKITRWDEGKTTITQIDLGGNATKVPASSLKNLLNLTYSKDGKWILASIVSTMGFSQSIVAIEVGGDRVVDFLHQGSETTGDLLGCRPTIRPDGKMVTWAVALRRKLAWIDVAPIDMDAALPKCDLANKKDIVSDVAPIELYHPDWSPNGRYIAFSRGERAGIMAKKAPYTPGAIAKGWDIAIVDTQKPGVYTFITRDGQSNKEPDWLKASD
ncbi:hypothetical protein LLG95_02810 [bacterium]|nr:hypothetical protein [bacterium]